MPWAPIIAAGIGAGGSILGGIFGSRKSKEEKAALEAQMRLQQTQADALNRGVGLAEGFAPQAGRFLDTAEKGFAAPSDYWTRILSGDQQEINRAVGPEASRISAAYGQATRNASMFLPRGGYASSKMAELPFSRAQDIGNLANTLRPQAARNLANIAGSQATIGSDLLGRILQMFGGAGAGAGATGGSLLNYNLQSNEQRFKTGASTGGALGAIFQKLGPLLKPKKPGTTGGGWLPGSEESMGG